MVRRLKKGCVLGFVSSKLFSRSQVMVFVNFERSIELVSIIGFKVNTEFSFLR